MFPKQQSPIDDLKRRMDRIDQSLLKIDLYLAGLFSIEIAKLGVVTPEELATIINSIVGELQTHIQKQGEQIPWVKNQAA